MLLLIDELDNKGVRVKVAAADADDVGDNIIVNCTEGQLEDSQSTDH